ncbi:MAG: hypothetical protein EP336_03635 [Rhodobacteraceae bacterium]|nr:MAG: hypothetical protein EP336_03635 [Paracoccaceae bacterium]
MAQINGTSGGDDIEGTPENDSIAGGDGADTIYGGAGDDQILGNDGLNSADGGDTIYAGDGADTVQGDGGDDIIYGDAGTDTLFGNDGNDYIDGGSDNDTLYGNDGNDTLLGSDGDDLIYAGAGDDILRGGAGNDTLYGHEGADTFIIADGSDFDTIEDYSAADGDILLIDYPGITSYADLEPYLSDDGNWGTLISLPDGSVTQVKWLNYNSQSASDFTFQSGTICFLKGTLIETEHGPRPVETLRPGDLVLTHDHGLQPLRLMRSRSYRFGQQPHKMQPIRIRPGALGPGSPARELIVSPQHRLALPQDAPDRIVAARKLLSWPGISARPSCRLAHYCHLVFDRHELVLANGAWAETLLITDYSRRLAPLPPALRHLCHTPVRRIATLPEQNLSPAASGESHPEPGRETPKAALPDPA